MVDFKQTFDGRGVPQNLEAERSVLGALLLHADAVADVSFLRPEDFYLPRHQVIFEGTWVHVGLAPRGTKPRRQVLTAVFRPGKRTTYQQGLPA